MGRQRDWEKDHTLPDITLSRMLTVLENQVQDEKNLETSYQRNKLSANLEYARSLLLRLEHDSTSIKVASRKQTVQADLQRKRELIKRLQTRLQEPIQPQDDDNDNDSSEEEDSASESEPTPSTAPPTTQTLPSQPDATLRPRKPPPPSTSPTAHTTARTTLFGSAPARSLDTSSSSTTAPADTALSAARVEQNDLTSSLLALAGALRASSEQFGAALEAERDVLDRAGAGLDRNAVGMEAASGRMGRLRRLAEGTGWLGRMMLYGYVAGLWVVAFLLVVGLPKLRF